jgi:SsrA-binding protein
MLKKKDVNSKSIVNRKAKYEYQLLDSFEAGLVLTGTEVKSVKEGNANLSDAYCLFENGNLTLKSMFIAEYKYGTIHNHETRRDRRLLLRKTELKKMERRVTEKGMTIVPYKLYFSERGFIKIQLYLAIGKKTYDKRESIKERQNKRDLDRIKKEY